MDSALSLLAQKSLKSTVMVQRPIPKPQISVLLFFSPVRKTQNHERTQGNEMKKKKKRKPKRLTSMNKHFHGARKKKFVKLLFRILARITL